MSLKILLNLKFSNIFKLIFWNIFISNIFLNFIKKLKRNFLFYISKLNLLIYQNFNKENGGTIVQVCIKTELIINISW